MLSDHQLDIIFDRTKSALSNQVNVPLSPGSICSEGQLLCAGAMLVHEALSVIRSPEEAQSFANRVLCEGPNFVEDTGEEIGLRRTMIVQTKRLNDSLDDTERLAGMMKALEDLRRSASDTAAISH